MAFFKRKDIGHKTKRGGEGIRRGEYAVLERITDIMTAGILLM